MISNLKEIFHEFKNVLERFHKKIYEILLSATIKHKISECSNIESKYKNEDKNILGYYNKISENKREELYKNTVLLFFILNIIRKEW